MPTRAVLLLRAAGRGADVPLAETARPGDADAGGAAAAGGGPRR
jgi:hypothetical protein